MIAIEMKKRNSRSAAPRSPRYGNKAMVMDSMNADMADGPAHRPMIKSCRDPSAVVQPSVTVFVCLAAAPRGFIVEGDRWI